ncbi:hypothetical protein [Actinoplanes subglobosus]|uniref:DUF4352 domain-containing protein n=1 Tax=Actinoplanes subglobosus TaxID=1547892 RepID=A0ABV8IK80_9ACTN
MSKPSRWLMIVVVAAVAASGGAVWGARRGRAATLPAVAPPRPEPVMPSAPAPMARPPVRADGLARAGTPRRSAVVTVALLAVVVLAGVLVTVLDRPAKVDPVPQAAAVVPNASAWTTPDLTMPATMPPTPPDFAGPTTAPTTMPPAPVPVGGVLPPDGSVVMRGDNGEEMILAVVRIDNPAPSVDMDNPSAPEIPLRLGYRLVAVHVRIDNTGGVPFLTDIEKHAWLVDKKGRTYPRNVEMTDARQLHPASPLTPEASNGRVIVFEIKGSVDITRFCLSLHPGVAKQTQEWRLT